MISNAKAMVVGEVSSPVVARIVCEDAELFAFKNAQVKGITKNETLKFASKEEVVRILKEKLRGGSVKLYAVGSYTIFSVTLSHVNFDDFLKSYFLVV